MSVVAKNVIGGLIALCFTLGVSLAGLTFSIATKSYVSSNSPWSKERDVVMLRIVQLEGTTAEVRAGQIEIRKDLAKIMRNQEELKN